MTERRKTIVRLGGEALAIFAGVAMALIAEDWRQEVGEREEARESLALIATDLRADSAAFASFQRGRARHAYRAANWLIVNWDDAQLNRDSIEVQLYHFSRGNFLQVSRSAFEGLRDANRLRLLDSEPLRAGLADYYQVQQPAVTTYSEIFFESITGLLDVLALHQRGLPGGDLEHLWPPAEQRVELLAPWSEISSDRLLHHRVLMAGRVADAGSRVTQDVEDRIAELLALVDAELAR